MQCACAVLSSVALLSLQYFFTLSHKRHDYRKKKVIEHKMRVLISYTFVRNISRSKKNRARYNKKYTLVFMYISHYFSQILMKIDPSRRIFRKMLKYQIS
jgi:hypothetical protein